MKRVVLTVASVLASIAVLPLLLSAAGAPAKTPPPGKAAQTNCCKAPFSYPERTSPNEPSRWAALSPCYESCGNGGEQSPVSLTGAVTTPGLPPLSFRYARNATVQVVNDTHTIKASTPGGGQFSIGTDVYELVEFHFHWLSEHRLGSAQTPLELHLVNKNAGGRTAAVGVFIERDPQNRDNPQLAKLWQRLADYHEQPTPVAGIDIQALVPTVLRSFRYAGSLTTPPCGQGLQWNVLATPIYASQAQITRFRTFFPTSNSRQPEQPLNGRRVLKDF